MTWDWHEQVLEKYGITGGCPDQEVSRISRNRCRIDNALVDTRSIPRRHGSIPAQLRGKEADGDSALKVQEVPVHRRVGGQLRMEGDRQLVPVPHGDRDIVDGR